MSIENATEQSTPTQDQSPLSFDILFRDYLLEELEQLMSENLWAALDAFLTDVGRQLATIKGEITIWMGIKKRGKETIVMVFYLTFTTDTALTQAQKDNQDEVIINFEEQLNPLKFSEMRSGKVAVELDFLPLPGGLIPTELKEAVKEVIQEDGAMPVGNYIPPDSSVHH